MQDIRRLMFLAYPGPPNEVTEAIAKDAFLGALTDRWLARKIYEREPNTLSETLSATPKVESYQQMEIEECRRKSGNRNTYGVCGEDADNETLSDIGALIRSQMVEHEKWWEALENTMARCNISPAVQPQTRTPRWVNSSNLEPPSLVMITIAVDRTTSRAAATRGGIITITHSGTIVIHSTISALVMGTCAKSALIANGSGTPRVTRTGIQNEIRIVYIGPLYMPTR